MKDAKKKYPNREIVAQFLLFSPMIQSLMEEVKELSKKKPDGPLNKLKVEMINKRLRPMKQLIGILPIAEFLDELDETTLPSNSDAVLILGQYEGAIKSFRDSFHGYDNMHTMGWWTDKGHVPDTDFK